MATKRAKSATPDIWDKPIYHVRLANLQTLVDKKFEGNATACARALGRSQNFIWQLLNKQRTVGEKTARYVEEVFGLQHLELDQSKRFEPKLHCDVQRAKGEKVTRYFVVPKVEKVDIVALLTAAVKEDGARKIARLAANAPAVLPCPVQCSDLTVYFEAWNRSLEPHVRAGDVVFVDPFAGTSRAIPEIAKHIALHYLTNERIYVVVPKRVKDPQPLLKIARGPYDHGYVFTGANEKEGVVPATDVKVLGRVVATLKIWKDEAKTE